MQNILYNLSLAIVLAPLFGCLLAGLLGKKLGPKMTHRCTIALVGLSFLLSVFLAKLVIIDNLSFNGTVYKWLVSGAFNFEIGFLIDRLSSLMIVTVTFVSFLVHIYSIGYMHKDPGYQRFFSYISLFTFSMLMLVTANNFLQIFFGWEAVGVVSYLLIGFWFKRESANVGSLKAFLVNRVGDFGFLLGIAAVLTFFGSLDFATVFAQAPQLAASHLAIFPGKEWSVITVICILLFVGAMGKSAQVPLHVWLPESMEGPTPISALIHAATMVTAGIYMVSRMSPLYELSATALSLVLVIGATGALFTGLLAVVQHDIKKVIAYSTLSQLGYMVAALGASAFAAGMFHLITHACFKALLFLAAGSVIIACHHNQDMRFMGGLRKYMPITYITFLIGSLSLTAIPPFAGFYSKEAIIEAVGVAAIPGSGYAYGCVLIGTFITALYTFRAFFLTFHATERMGDKLRKQLTESPVTVWLPLVVLAIPSIILGAILVKPILYQVDGLLGESILVMSKYDVLAELSTNFHGVGQYTLHALFSLPFWLAISGIVVAWLTCIVYPGWRETFIKKIAIVYYILRNKYGFDAFNQLVFVRGTIKTGEYFYKFSDKLLIDGLLVNGAGRLVAWVSKVLRNLQSGYLYHYAFATILGLFILLLWLVLV